jgi:hypothetical protein
VRAVVFLVIVVLILYSALQILGGGVGSIGSVRSIFFYVVVLTLILVAVGVVQRVLRI